MIGTVSRKRVAELRDGIAKTQDRIRHARKQFDQFDKTAGNSEAETRARRKLEADVARAENDLVALERALNEMHPVLSHSEARAFAEGVETAEDA
jgi:predicted  nucleic acid-binding Zn-ribbon protein